MEYQGKQENKTMTQTLYEIARGQRSIDLKTCSLSTLINYKAYTTEAITKLERSAKEIKGYMVLDTPAGDVACTEVQNLKNELASHIERQAEIYKDHLSSIDKEIAKRLGAMQASTPCVATTPTNQRQ